MKEIWGIKEVEVSGTKKTFWTRIGIAHESADGSLNCKFDYVPVGPGITIQIKDKKGDSKNGTVQEG